MDTMTLEELRESLDVGCLPNTDRPCWFAAIDAAIRERDELRKIERIATSEMIPDVVRWRERAEKAEAELAALKKRIDRFSTSLPVGWWSGRLHAEWDADKESIFTRAVEGKRVRLLVEDSDGL